MYPRNKMNTMPEKQKQQMRDEVNCFEKFSYRVVSGTETFFYK